MDWGCEALLRNGSEDQRESTEMFQQNPGITASILSLAEDPYLNEWGSQSLDPNQY